VSSVPGRGGAGGGAGEDSVHEVRVRISGGATYPVVVGVGILDRLPGLLQELAPAHRYVIIGDERVLEHHGTEVRRLVLDAGSTVEVLGFPPGEEHKNRGEWARLTDEMLRLGTGRDGCVLALGGGVSGDLAGFVAATYMRGIPVVQIPTSLVAMVDSSVGGKTGVDVPMGKNLVGAFHPPRFVLADAELIRTLPRSERSQGLAEALKHGAIRDRPYLERLQALAPRLLAGDEHATAGVVARSVEIKADVVSRDEREGGLRQILNFGHTLGHALEAASGYRISHGTAVGLGMILEARLGEVVGVTAPGTATHLEAAVRSAGLRVTLPAELDGGEVVAHLGSDKKARAGQPRFVLLEGLGTVHGDERPGMGWSHAVPVEEVRQVLESFQREGI
jgi:3-dehydroquinate synthase